MKPIKCIVAQFAISKLMSNFDIKNMTKHITFAFSGIKVCFPGANYGINPNIWLCLFYTK